MIVLEKTHLSTIELANEGLVIDVNGFIVTPFMSFVIIVGIGLIFLLLSTNSFIKTDFSKINRSSSDASDLWG
ncbi:MAG: type transport system permease protein [Peptostreptococcaceae bacterium]|jgi:ABC-2 type transport system permease protein|nr:type transport system permease protein [Peptostreptococcaceae bacterium]